MLKRKKIIPLDYSLCTMTVTVYRREGLTRRVLEGVHFEFTDRSHTESGRSSHSRGFLLVIPGSDPIAPGDKVVLGIGPEGLPWEALNTASMPTLGVVNSVKPRFFGGSLCHTEARSNAD
jgi:hypothetical protein